jgi:hypothetical protein
MAALIERDSRSESDNPIERRDLVDLSRGVHKPTLEGQEERAKKIAALELTIPAKRRVVALRLASGQSVVDIASDMKIPARTLYSWLANRKYRTYVDELRLAICFDALGILTDGCTKAARVTVARVDDPDPMVSLKAAGMVMDYTMRFGEYFALERRVKMLEATYAAAREVSPYGNGILEDDPEDEFGIEGANTG